MKLTKLLIVVLLLGTTGISYAGGGHRGHHHRSHGHFSVIVGPYWGPFWGPRYYPPPYYAPIVVERPVPQVYIEQPPVASAPGGVEASNYWYYCAPAGGYYPYVKECPGGWQRVLPQAPGQP
ncbi:MAG: hypothetical protein Q8S20_13905 [Sulfuritalea sp.]|nr:hypothetical protein [Sulfuritalea sp.]